MPFNIGAILAAVEIYILCAWLAGSKPAKGLQTARGIVNVGVF